jgi:hypothetical protein
MVQKNQTSGVNRVFASPSARRLIKRSVAQIKDLTVRSVGHTGDARHSVLGTLAKDEKTWTRSGMGYVLADAGVSRLDVLNDLEKSCGAILNFISDPDNGKKVVKGIQKMGSDSWEGTLTLPVDDRYIKTFKTLRDIVNDRGNTPTYRNVHGTPSIHFGHCSICATQRKWRFFQRFVSPSGRAKLSRTGLVNYVGEALDSSKKEMLNIVPELFADLNEMTEQDAFCFSMLIEGDNQPDLLTLIVCERTAAPPKKHRYWEVRTACMNCLHGMDDPRSVVGAAHAVKWLTDIRYSMMSVRDDKLRRWMHKHIEKADLDRRKAQNHFDETGRLKDVTSGVDSHMAQSLAFKPIDEDAMARDLFQAGFADQVQRPRNKDQRWRLKRPFNLPLLRAQMEAAGKPFEISDDDFVISTGEEE